MIFGRFDKSLYILCKMHLLCFRFENGHRNEPQQKQKLYMYKSVDSWRLNKTHFNLNNIHRWTWFSWQYCIHCAVEPVCVCLSLISIVSRKNKKNEAKMIDCFFIYFILNKVAAFDVCMNWCVAQIVAVHLILIQANLMYQITYGAGVVFRANKLKKSTKLGI